MSYNITVSILPSGSSFYVKASSTNPTTIEAGGSVTLNFSADGTYYQMYKAQASAVSVTGATITSWTSATPYTSGELVISNPTDNVSVAMTARSVIAPQSIARPFKYAGKAPIDVRIVLTKAQMLEIIDNQQPDYYFAVCKDDSKIYIYDKSSTANSETGKFTPLQFDIPETEQAKADFASSVETAILQSTEVKEAIAGSLKLDGEEITAKEE